MKSARFGETLRALVRHEVEFVVVGMAAGILQSVPLTTLDVDVVHRRTKYNVARLLAALTGPRAFSAHRSQTPRWAPQRPGGHSVFGSHARRDPQAELSARRGKGAGAPCPRGGAPCELGDYFFAGAGTGAA